jgi:hypothetical protein
MNDDHQSHKEQDSHDKAATTQEIGSTNKACPSDSPRHKPPKSILGIPWDRFTEVLMAVAIAAFTGLLWWTSTDQITVMKEQTSSMQGQLNIMKETVRHNERAWVTVKTGKLTNVVSPGGPPLSVVIEIQNTGHSPALDVTMDGSLLIKSKLPEGDILEAPHSPYETKTVVGPTVTMTMDIKYKRQILQTDVDRLFTGKAYVFALGIIQYKDIFMEPHTTSFCLRTMEGQTGTGFLAGCPKWNTAN